MKMVKQYWEFPEYQIVGGEGYRVTVEWQGKRYECTDMNSGYWQYLFGYQHPEFLKIFADSSSYQPPSLFVSLHEEIETVGKEIERLTGFSHALWLASGSGAVDAGIRMADVIRPGRMIVSVRHGFHGSNATALAASGFEFMHTASFIKEESFVLVESNERGIAEIERLASEDRLACVIFEPIQGVGGAFVLSQDFLMELQKLRKKYDFFLIADEVSSFARTGHLLSSCIPLHVSETKGGMLSNRQDHNSPPPLIFRGGFKYSPDLVCLGKGISCGYVPVSLVLASDEVIERHEQVGKFFYGNTLAGTRLACRLVQTTLRLLENGGLVRVRALGKRIDEEARKCRISLRGAGIMRAIDFGSKRQAGAVAHDLIIKHDFFTIPEGRYLMLMPSIVLPEGEIRRFFIALSDAESLKNRRPSISEES